MNCGNCGAQLPPGAARCPQCGGPSPVGPKHYSTVMGMSPPVTALLAYVFGWISGLVIFFVEKDPFIRFHAMQSVVVFGSLHVVYQSLRLLVALMSFFDLFAIIFFAIYSLVGLLAFVLWILLMVKAAQGQYFKLPVAGDVAQRILAQSGGRWGGGSNE